MSDEVDTSNDAEASEGQWLECRAGVPAEIAVHPRSSPSACQLQPRPGAVSIPGGDKRGCAMPTLSWSLGGLGQGLLLGLGTGGATRDTPKEQPEVGSVPTGWSTPHDFPPTHLLQASSAGPQGQLTALEGRPTDWRHHFRLTEDCGVRRDTLS